MIYQDEIIDEEVKKLLHKVALICLSEEFKELRRELEAIYHKYQEEDAPVSAFQDALFTLLAQDENKDSLHSRAN